MAGVPLRRRRRPGGCSSPPKRLFGFVDDVAPGQGDIMQVAIGPLAQFAPQAAIDGIGVAMGRTSYVEADIAKGRLLVPFEIALPADAGFYLVSPQTKADSPKLAAFRQWLIASAQNKA
jgi:DNA-binding transcriptional LysR family regulator